MFTESPNHEKRQHVRVSSPAQVVCQETAYEVMNWSLGGCLLNQFDQSVKTGDCLDIEFQLTAQDGCQIITKPNVEIVWVSAESQKVGLRFLSLSPFEQNLLNNYIQQIPEIDPIESSLLTSQQLNPAHNLPLNNLSKVRYRRRNPKVIVSSLACLMVGGMFGYYTLFGLRQSITTMAIKSAVISQPVEPIPATNWGTIQATYVQEGHNIVEGDPLFLVSNDLKVHEEMIRVDNLLREQDQKIKNTTEKLALSRLELADAELELRKATALEQEEKDAIVPQADISNHRLQSAQAKVEALTIQVQMAKDSHQRWVMLFNEGAVSQQRVDDAWAKVADLEGKHKAAIEELEIARTVIQEVKEGNVLDHNRLITNVQRLTINKENTRQQIELAEEKVGILTELLVQHKQEKQTLKSRRYALQNLEDNLAFHQENNLATVYKSPVSGAVVKLFKSSGNTIKRNEDLILVQENLQQPIINAYLTQEQASLVAIGSEARVTIPGTEKSYQAEIVRLDRTGGFADPIQGQHQLQGSLEQSAHVELKILDHLVGDEKDLVSGTPVTLEITKNKGLTEQIKLMTRLLP